MKKIISMLLAVAMVASLAACGGGTTSTTPSTSTPSASTPSTSTPAASTPSASTPAEPITLTVGVPANTVVADWDNNDYTKMLEEKTGYNIEFAYFSSNGTEYKTQVTAQLAGGDELPDILFAFSLSDAEKTAYGAEGLFVDLAQFYDDKEFMSQFQWYQTMQKDFISDEIRTRAWTEGREPGGEWWGAINEIGVAGGDTTLDMIYINQKWLDNLGLEYPTTPEAFADVLRAFKTQDPNQNGKADELPVVGTVNVYRGWIDAFLINNWIFYSHDYPYNATDDGTIYRPELTDEYREALKYLAGLYDEGLISELTWTIKDRSELISMLTPADGNSTVGVWGGHATLCMVDDNPTVYDYVGLKPFEGSGTPINPSKVTYQTFITSDCENPEAAFRLIMAMGDDDALRQQRYGTEGKDWHWVTDWEDGAKGLKIDNSNAFSSNTTTTWGFVTNIIYGNYGVDYPDIKDIPPTNQSEDVKPVEGELTWKQYRDDYMQWETKTLPYFEAAAKYNPKNVVYKLIYTEDEADARTDINTDCTTYIKTARAEFITGVRDINDDKAWEQYKKDLEGLGIQTLIDFAQAAYDRSK